MASNLQTNSENYFIQLDALRAFAVAMVIFSHWTGYHENMWNDDVFWFNGEVGVKMFFIISGFLITRILLAERHRSEQLRLAKGGVLKSFYVRRFLRIFPAYYATIFFGLVAAHPDMLASWKWHVIYMSNFLFALRGQYMGDVSHFWSLAVEEQFYILWPVLMLFLNRRHLLPLIISCIAIAPIFRYVLMFILNQNDVTVSVLPLSSLDCLSAGALLAYLNSPYADAVARKIGSTIMNKVCLACGVAFVLFNSSISVSPDYEWYGVFVSRLLLVPALLGVVILFAKGFAGVTGKFLQWRVVSYPGKISYGIYLFHFFVPGVTLWLLDRVGWAPDARILLVINICVLLAMASFSWHLFEDPVNRLKSYFPYINKRTFTAKGPQVSNPAPGVTP